MKIPSLKNMTLREKIGQLFIMRDDRLHDMIPNDELSNYLANNPLGGIWATSRLKKPATYLNFEANSDSGELSDLYEYVEFLNSCSKIPLLIGGDSEKGGFMGSSEIAGPDAVVATNDSELPYRYAKCMAAELKVGGLNWRWSPISDLASHGSSVSVNRICSDAPDKVIAYSKAVIKGTQDVGVAATVKHFPGQDLYETRDSHFMAAVNNATFEEWMSQQGRVYKESIDSGAYSVMIGHNAFPAIDDSMIGTKRRPATFSKKIITDLLKNEWGFDGVVVTDDIGMRSALSIYGRDNMADMYVELIWAGNDMLLGTPIGENHEDYIGAVEKAVRDGRITEDRINDACSRVLKMKEKLGLFELPKKIADLDEIKKETHLMNKDVAENSLTLLANKKGFLPVANDIKNIAVIAVTHSNEFVGKLEELKKAFAKRNINVDIYENVYMCNLAETAISSDVIIYANFISSHQPMGHCSFFGDVAQQFFKILSYGSDKSVIVSFGSPFLKYEYYEESDTFINAYWHNKETMEALAAAILGEIPFKGISPFEV